MKLKRIIPTSIAFAALLTIAPLESSAEENISTKNFEGQTTIQGEIFEFDGVQVSSGMITPEGIALASGGKRNWSITNYRPLGLTWYTVAKADTQKAHDKLGARARLFKKSGSLWKSNSNTQKNTKIVSATAKPDSYINNFNGAYSIGNFTFEKSGYVHAYPELRKNW